MAPANHRSVRCRHPYFCLFFPVGATLLLGFQATFAQSAVDANGNALTQSAAIEQARLFQRPAGTETTGMTADGTALPNAGGGNPEDDSFGAQQMLKAEQPQRAPEFLLSGDAAMFYTSNVALTRRDTVADSFFVANAALTWNHAISPEMLLQVGARASLFRYVDTSALDFETLGAGIGLSWAPRTRWGITMFVRYDFSELLDKHSRELLQDHEFTFGAQKVFVFNRVHALTLGVLGSAGISDPFAEQRDQIGAFAGYSLFFTRRLNAEIGYRIAGFFYNEGGRNDFNQAVNLGLHYRFTSWMEANALLSFAMNRSSRSAFDYDVFNGGGSLSFTLHF